MTTHNDLVKALRGDPGEERTAQCPKCLHETTQTLEQLNPDDPNDFLAWQCQDCGELVEIE